MAMYIRVKRSKTTYFIQCDPTETTLDIKQKLHTLIDQPVNDQRLILMNTGDILEDSKTLADQKVENDAVVVLTLRKGKPELYVVLCLASENETQFNRMPPDVEDIVNSYHLTPFITEEYAAAGTLNQNYANILLMLLRLRQACDHPLLVKGFNNDFIRNSDSVENSNPVGQVSVEMAKTLPRELLINLLNSLETSFAICLVCQDEKRKMVASAFGEDQSRGSATRLTVEYLRYLFIGN
ncbi:hypothetical protein J1N35_036685 [Gossypium stocksii]|uniref:Ubiquitin-like domain-containing protein n=1 Tax=Gossypium stocksii TaxID=47602 RepID=A0A9D3ZK68_9ROSI|nr:hypothetical protein J1N35_036685 [Gossypium stocksii]